jgi:hypothetical protein
MMTIGNSKLATKNQISVIISVEIGLIFDYQGGAAFLVNC